MDALVRACPDVVGKADPPELVICVQHEPLLHRDGAFAGKRHICLAVQDSGHADEALVHAWEAGDVGGDDLEGSAAPEVPVPFTGATLGSPSWPIGPQGLLRFLSHTMPDFPMMRCTFLRLILTFCSWARQPTICRDPFLKPCEAKAASTCPFAAGSAFSRSRCAATQSQRPRLEASRAPQAALTLKDGSSSLSWKISPNLSGFSAARGARWALLASVPRAFKAFACAFRDSISARCEAMAFSSRLLARSFCLASPSSISASSRAPMALCLSTASRFSRRMLSTLSRCLTWGASVFVRAPSILASFQRQAARSMRLQPMREAGSPAWAKIPPGLSPSWQRLMHPSLNRSEQTGDPVLTSSTASSGMRQARSSFVNLPSIIYGAPFHPWPAAGRNRAVSRFRIGCAEYGVQVTKLGEAYRIYAPVLKKGGGPLHRRRCRAL